MGLTPEQRQGFADTEKRLEELGEHEKLGDVVKIKDKLDAQEGSLTPHADQLAELENAQIDEPQEQENRQNFGEQPEENKD